MQERVAGIVTAVREGLVQTEGAHAVLTIEPALAATRHEVDTRTFQHMSMPAILEQVLGEDLAAFGRSRAFSSSLTGRPRT